MTDKKQTNKTDVDAAERERVAAPTSGDAGAAEVQQAMDEATAQGFIGEKADKTPNDAYTVAGVTKGKPTPETEKDGPA